MAAQKDGRKIFSLSSFLITLGLGVVCGYFAFVGGFWSGTGDFLLKIYALAMAICGGFALSSCIHLIMVPKGTPKDNLESASSVTTQQGNPSPTNKMNNSSPNLAPQSKPVSKPIEQKRATPNPGTKIPATQSIPAKSPVPVTQNTNTEPQAVKLIGPVARNNMQFLETFIKLANIAKSCQELVENEKDLSKKEQVRLSLQRREFKQMYSTVKNSRFESF